MGIPIGLQCIQYGAAAAANLQNGCIRADIQAVKQVSACGIRPTHLLSEAGCPKNGIARRST
jgi:hypothetical protein